MLCWGTLPGTQAEGQANSPVSTGSGQMCPLACNAIISFLPVSPLDCQLNLGQGKTLNCIHLQLHPWVGRVSSLPCTLSPRALVSPKKVTWLVWSWGAGQGHPLQCALWRQHPEPQPGLSSDGVGAAGECRWGARQRPGGRGSSRNSP